MKDILRVEMKRAVSNRSLMFSVLIGMSIAIFHEISYVLPATKQIDILIEHGVYPYSLFNSWLGAMLTTLPNTLFYFILPIVATIPYAMSYFDDCKSGVIKNICIRTKKEYYLLSKYIAVFSSAAFSIAFSLCFSLWLTALSVPALTPDASTGVFTIIDKNMWSQLFYRHPFVYTFLYIFIDAIFAGLFSTLSLMITHFTDNKFVVILTPFIVYLIVYFIVELNFDSKYDPVHFLNPSQPVFSSPLIIVTFGVVLFIVSFGGFYYRSKRDEIF